MEQDERIEPVRVLHIVGSMHPGGIQNFIMNLYENIDRTRVQFDVILHEQTEGDYCDRIRELGGKVYKLPRMTAKPIANLRGIRKIVREGKYNIVIRHTPNAVVAPQLVAAKRGGAKCVILHSHSTNNPGKIRHRLGRFWIRHMRIERFACSEEAGRWMFGNSEFPVVRNAIDTERFAFSVQKRETTRRELGIEDSLLFGHIGNFAAVKNHTFLMQVFHEMAGIREDIRLICVGDGDLRVSVERQAAELGIADRVIFTGIRRDTDCIMCAMDMMIFPSVYEGIPLTLIEAQTEGLPMVISDTIHPGARVTDDLIHCMSIQQSPKAWAQEILAIADQKKERRSYAEEVGRSGYNISEIAGWYEEYFMSCGAGQKE